MKAVVQRVSSAGVVIDNKLVSEINQGLLVFIGVVHNDTEQQAERLAKKICGLRIFSDENDKINLSLSDVDGEILVVSQFTLYADCKKGYRPSFINAGEPQEANRLYEFFIGQCKLYQNKVKAGVFGADMKINLVNDGPFTLILEQ